ncbi:MAG: hypothetical protein FKY71_08090 [Spiribacter salinus]|uniref:Uncharacterized protein n=1 Tax=Spiribacter salinus TaxID=1335746 RepID=A0A540VS19_9GAMM|nr:MAG: hypothetical protein FKY71_08090 [Spiribacter salinus]
MEDRNKHLDRMTEALERERMSNVRPAVDEASNAFEKAVNNWHALQELHEELKRLIKPLAEAEREQRNAIAESLTRYFGDELKEGVNTYKLSNGRKLKLTFNRKREIDQPSIARAREMYTAAATADSPVFDDILRVKYELSKSHYNKLPEGSGAQKAVQAMLVTKPAASELGVD